MIWQYSITENPLKKILKICNMSQSSSYINIFNIYETGIRKWKSTVLNVCRKEMLSKGSFFLHSDARLAKDRN